MKPEPTIQTWEIVLLTPLHVGDGSMLIDGMDYTVSKNVISIYHIDTLIGSIADNPKAVNDLGRMNLQKFLQNYRLDVQPDYAIPFAGNSPGDIRRFLKNAYGEPYLAGSTLKGAIRTALWNTLDRGKLPPANNFKPFNDYVKSLVGQPQNDFLRPLSISDSPGIDPQESLRAEEVRIFNVKIGNKPGWKDFSKKTTRDQYKDVTGIFVEALKPETRLHVRVELGAFLQQSPVNVLHQIPKAKGLLGTEDLANVVNAHSRKIAEAERVFFAGFGQACVQATSFYNDLLQSGFKMIEKIPGAFLLRMAWSSGWKGMTGDWVDPGDIETVRKENNLGKNFCPHCKKQIYGSPKKGKYFCRTCKNNLFPSELELSSIFPKTRRLAIKDGIPSQPMGWVMVLPTSESFFSKAIKRSIDEKSSETISSKTIKPEDISGEKRAGSIPQHENTPIESMVETWENASLAYTPNNDTITATHGKRKASVQGKEPVPERLHKLLFGKKKFAAGQKVDVEAVGNMFKIVKIY